MFVGVTDPVGASLVDFLRAPGGNAQFGPPFHEYSFGGKRLELLKQVAPGVTRVAVLRDPSNPSGGAEFAAIQALAQSLKLDVSPVDTRRDAGEIERAITTFARTANGGLIVTPNASASVHRDLIVALAARHRLPAVYPFRHHADGGGLVSYGPDVVDQCRKGSRLCRSHLEGEKPADLPVQAPTKYEMVINLYTAKALGLTLSGVIDRPRRRGDRINSGSMSAIGTRPPYPCCAAHVRFWGVKRTLFELVPMSRL